MTPQEFVAKWKQANLSERAACQEHFIDLCNVLGQPTPAKADPDGAFYTFERGVSKTDGGQGWADVWFRGHFGWEYKGKHKDLAAAYGQLLLYREALENPPLLVVCDLDRFEVHTNFTGTAKRVYRFDLDHLAEPGNLDTLRKLFIDPNALRPGQTTESVTRHAAERFGLLADGMRVRGIPAQQAAHFLMKLMFCMFAEDIGLLGTAEQRLFKRILANSRDNPPRLAEHLGLLFQAMATGGYFGADTILHFNGGLFADADVIELRPDEIKELILVNEYDWASVEPSIFGTLFERTLDPTKRSQIGAHYTSRADILTLLEPVVMVPLRREWADVKAKCDALWDKLTGQGAGGKGRRATSKESKPRKDHDRLLQDFVERLAHVSILDPACGSGNFLYVAINLLLDLEKEAITYAAAHGTSLLPQVRPTQLLGIEINPVAQQLAQVVIWIGYLQWKHDNGFPAPRNPVLDPIESIQLRDAIINLSDPQRPTEPIWPTADFIVGNPPFLGDKKMRGELGDSYVDAVRTLYSGRLPGGSDLCCYWFEKARRMVAESRARRAGLLATQGIRGGSNRAVVDRIKEKGDIFFAVADRDWILDGATVHVSMIGFDNGDETQRELNGAAVSCIASNLTPAQAAAPTITLARPLAANADKCFLGIMKSGPFDISETSALAMLQRPNPNGLPNSNVLRPRLTARDILQRLATKWVIDFGCEMSEHDAALFADPWQHAESTVKPKRATNRLTGLAANWWLHARPRPAMRRAVNGLPRFIVTPEVSKHRVFVWLDHVYLPDHQTRVFARSDDYFFGVLHSRVHEVWARAMGTQLRERESGFRYTPTSCFEPFPLPEPNDSQSAAVGNAALELDRLRSAFLNPPEWTHDEVLTFPGSVDGPWARYIEDPNSRGIGTVRYRRLAPNDEDCAKQLAKRTLTNLYNQRPAWLDHAHRRLDEAVSAAYGWPTDITDDEILAKLLELNLARQPAE